MVISLALIAEEPDDEEDVISLPCSLEDIGALVAPQAVSNNALKHKIGL
ncbi:MAG: hypothetical protein II541_12780 [Prevotella sp.]|nr:hypothetical protein [Prevotella sp.]